MAIQTEYMLDGELIEVGFAKDFQESARNSKVMRFEKPEFEMKILKANPEAVLVVKSTIGSFKKVNSVSHYNETLDAI